MQPRYCPQRPVISFNCCFVGLYPVPLEWVSRESAICCIREPFCSTCSVSCSRSQSSALTTTKSAPARRVTLIGVWLLTTCSTKDFKLSLKRFTLMESIIFTSCTAFPYNHSSNALARQCTGHQKLRTFCEFALPMLLQKPLRFRCR